MPLACLLLQLGAVNWYDDAAGSDLAPQDQQDLDSLEQRVFALLTDLNKALSAHGGPLPGSNDDSGRALSAAGPASLGGSLSDTAGDPVNSRSSSSESDTDDSSSQQKPGLELLPPGVWSYAPPAPAQKSLARVLQDAGECGVTAAGLGIRHVNHCVMDALAAFCACITLAQCLLPLPVTICCCLLHSMPLLLFLLLLLLLLQVWQWATISPCTSAWAASTTPCPPARSTNGTPT